MCTAALLCCHLQALSYSSWGWSSSYLVFTTPAYPTMRTRVILDFPLILFQLFETVSYANSEENTQ